MALSNWETLALDADSEPCAGRITSPLGVTVEIYKNWLYVSDTTAWRHGGGYVEPIVMEVHEARLRYIDVDIVARRGPKDGVFCVVDTGLACMVGIGCSGYDDDGRWLGIEQPEVEFLRALISVADCGPRAAKIDLAKALRFNQGDAFLVANLGRDADDHAVTTLDDVMEIATLPGAAAPTILSRMFATPRRRDPNA